MFFRKKSKSTKTAKLDQSSRYAGNPMLRILELYVLDAINQISAEDETKMKNLAPKLAQSLGQTGSWQDIVSKSMQLPNNMADSIHELWEKNRKIAKDANQELSSQKFAEMFVDTNLT